MDVNYMNAFNVLSKQHTVLVYERNRLQDVRARRGTSMESEYEIKLQAKIDALNETLRGLAKLLEL